MIRVLIADDQELVRTGFRVILEAEGDIEVVAEAENSLDALQACSQHRPDMVLLDIAMPGVDGLEAARHLAAFDPRPAVVFCTAYDEHALSAFEAAAIDYLMKPLSARTRTNWVNTLFISSFTRLRKRLIVIKSGCSLPASQI